nr:hypothetical protein [uncultured Desulfobacter sp.]
MDRSDRLVMATPALILRKTVFLIANIQIINDDEQVCRFLVTAFQKIIPDVCYHLTLKEGLARLGSDTVDGVFIDVNLPDGKRA